MDRKESRMPRKNWGLQSKNELEFFHHHGKITRKYICFSLALHEKKSPSRILIIGPPSGGFEDQIYTNVILEGVMFLAKTLK